MNHIALPALIAISLVVPRADAATLPLSGTARTVATPPAMPSEKSAPVARKSTQHRPHPPSPAIARVADANRVATQQPQAQGFVNAVQVYPFSDGAIFQLYAAPGAVSDIMLQPGENLVAVASGDTARWVIGDTTSGSGAEKRRHVMVKPFASGLVTNLVITTDRRSYHLKLTATAKTAMAALSWTYPAEQLIALRRAAEQVEAITPVAQGVAIDQLHFDYALSGDRPAWRPLRAFDDGRQTYIEFPRTIATGEAPPLFVVGPSGEAELVNYRVRGRFYVVDRIFDRAELRIGTRDRQVVRIDRTGAAGGGRKGGRS